MNRVVDRLGTELSAGAGQGATWDELGEAISRAIAPTVAHDAVRLVATSPTSGVGLAPFAFWHGYEPDFARTLLRNFFTGGDPQLPADRARRPVLSGVVGAGDRGGRREQVTRRIFAEHGAGCELRLLLRDSRGIWGSLGLLRARGARPFDGDEVRRVASLGPALIAALRALVRAGPLWPAAPTPPAGVVIVGADHTIRAETPQAGAWWQPPTSRHGAPDWLRDSFFIGLSLQTRSRMMTPLVCVPAAIYGRWVAIQGQLLDDQGAGDVAIVLQTPTAEQLLPAFGDWYGITARERGVIAELWDAAAPKQIARRLGLSVYTVNDHLKAVFRKTGAGSRAELMAALTG